MLNVSVIDWILENHPDEAPFLKYADRSKTFEDLWACLDRHDDVYYFLGINDSVDREYAFEGLVEALNLDGWQVEYDDVYFTWLDKRESVIDGLC